MARPKRTALEKERDLHRTTQLYVKGRTQQEIAEELGVTQQQVSYDIAEIKKRWREESFINMDEAKQQELATIENLKREYWQAWERSLDERTKTRTEQSKGAGDKTGTAKATVEKETLLGNPAYLAGIQWCISERSKILGLYAPNKIAPTTPDGKEPYDGLSDDERAIRVAAILDRARKRRDRQAADTDE